MLVNINIRNILKTIIILVVFILISFDLFKSYQEIPLHWDEYIYVSRARFFDLYKNLDWKNKKFLSYESYETVKLPEYIYGLTINIGGHENIKLYFNNVSFNKLDIDTIPQWYSKDLFKNVKISNFPKVFKDKIEPILLARNASLVLTIFSLIVIFYIGYLLSNYLLGIIYVIIFYLNPIFKTTLLRAMSEPVLIFLFLIHFILSLSFFKELSKGNMSMFKLAGLAVFSGLLLSTKITGVVNYFYFFTLFTLIIYFKHNFKMLANKFISAILIYGIVSIITFMILNPFVLFSPIKNTFRIFAPIVNKHYISRPSNVEKDSLKDYSARLYMVYERVISPNGWFANFTSGISIRNIYYSNLPLDIIMFILGIGIFLKNLIVKRKIEDGIFLWWGITIISIISLLIPFDWDRYYLPIILVVSMIQGIAVYFVLVSIKNIWLNYLLKKIVVF